MRLTRFLKAEHYESDVYFDSDPVHGMIVIKKYKTDNECVRWLNRYLAQYYDTSKGQPVGQHECAALKLLEPYGFVPKVVDLRLDSLAMEFAGDPLSPEAPIEMETYLNECRHILKIFAKLKFRHNDLRRSNVLLHDGKVKIIDFTLSEFGDIQVIKGLPNPNWARAGQDDNLLTYMSPRSQRTTVAFGRIRKFLKKIGFAPGA
jgi:hypothetical protein